MVIAADNVRLVPVTLDKLVSLTLDNLVSPNMLWKPLLKLCFFVCLLISMLDQVFIGLIVVILKIDTQTINCAFLEDQFYSSKVDGLDRS